jgi:hypothetical protein
MPSRNMISYRFRILLPILFALVAAGAARSQTPPQDVTVLHAARLLDIESGRVLTPGELLVKGDRIVEAGTAVKRPAGAAIIELGDRTLLPGLIDAHVHLFLHPGRVATRRHCLILLKNRSTRLRAR